MSLSRTFYIFTPIGLVLLLMGGMVGFSDDKSEDDDGLKSVAEGRPRFFIEIDGVSFGEFSHVEGVDDSGEIISHSDAQDHAIEISLARDFVTDLSLYVWAHKSFSVTSEGRDVVLIIEFGRGQRRKKTILRRCKAMQLSIEAADSAVGGFHEKIVLIVQEAVAVQELSAED